MESSCQTAMMDMRDPGLESGRRGHERSVKGRLWHRTRRQRQEFIGLPHQFGRRLKDVTFREDTSLIHVGHGPTVMALLRDAAVTLLHRAAALVVGPLPTGA